MPRIRLDELLVKRGLAPSREKAQALILSGSVWSEQRRLEKAGQQVDEQITLELRNLAPAFASRAGQKLAHALETFAVSPEGLVALDLGASTGGFTDCLLKSGAKHVFAIDVGYGQFDSKLRADAKVTCIERFNARYLTRKELQPNPNADKIDLVVADLSFISLRKVIEPVRAAFPEVAHWVLLFKPQFEVGRKNIGKGGVVKSEAATHEALQSFDAWAQQLGLIKGGEASCSPLAGKKSGNLEYLLYYVGQPKK